MDNPSGMAGEGVFQSGQPSPPPEKFSPPQPHKIIEEWRQAIKELEEEKQRVLRLRIDEQKISEILKGKEAEAKRKIVMATTEDGKKLYRNEAEREMAMYNLLKEDIDYQGLKDELKDVKRKKDESYVRIEILKEKIELYKAIINLYGGEKKW